VRYRPKPERQPDPFPVRIDVSDIEAFAQALGEDVVVTITTEEAHFDGVDDLMQHVHSPTRFEEVRFDITPPKGDAYWVKITPHLVSSSYDAPASAAEKKLNKLLLRCSRNQHPHRVAIVAWAVASFLFGAMPNVLFHEGKGDLAPGHFVPYWGMCLAMLPVPAMVWSTGFWFSSRLVPRRREPRFFARNRNTILVGALGALVGGLITAIIHALGAK